MDMTSIAAAQASISALFGITKAATAAAVDRQLKERLIEIQKGVLEAQQQLGDAQAERLSLLQEMADLRNRLHAHESAKAALSSYKLHEIEAGKFLYKADETHAVEHFACPTCHNAGKVAVLQSAKTGTQQRVYRCGTCALKLVVGPSDPSQPRRSIGIARPDW